MTPSRRQLLVCASLALAAGAILAPPAGRHAQGRRRAPPPHERAYGLIEDIDDRQLGEFLASRGAPPAASPPNCRARPA